MTGTAGFSALRWSAMAKYGCDAMQFCISICMARILAPEYYGLLGMATVVVGFAGTLTNVGLSSAIIQRDDVDQALLSTIFWVNLAITATITVLLIITAPLAGWLYSNDQITYLVIALSFNTTINAFSMVPTAILQRKLDFRRLAIRELLCVAIAGVIGILSGILGCGVWSLVVHSFASSISSLLLVNSLSPFCPQLSIDRKRLSECLKFGLFITGFNVFNYFARNVDNLIIGVYLGPVALGFYALAYKIMLLPRDSVTSIVNRVLFPKIARISADCELVEVYYRVCSGIAFVTFPVMAGMAAVSGPFVDIILGTTWKPAAIYIALLAPIGALGAVGSTVGQLYLCKRRSDLLFSTGVVASIVQMASMLLGIQWSIQGMIVSYSIATVLLYWGHFCVCSTIVEGLSVKRLAKILIGHFCSAALCFIAATYGPGLICLSYGNTYGWFLGAILCGGLTYAVTALIFRPRVLLDLESLATVKIRWFKSENMHA